MSAVGFFLLISIIAILYNLSKNSSKSVRRMDKVQYGSPTKTMKGEFVRSKSESQIADYFHKKGINYDYEYDIRGIGKPDFYLPDYDLVVEFWGLVDLPNEYQRKKYEKQMRWKMAKYHSRKI